MRSSGPAGAPAKPWTLASMLNGSAHDAFRFAGAAAAEDDGRKVIHRDRPGLPAEPIR